MISDEVGWFQAIGSAEERLFYHLSSLPDNIKLLPSAWNNYPTTEKPSNRFKFFSAEFTFKKDLKVINRVTYSVLDWLGDCGGLVDALIIIGQLIANPFSVIAL